MRQEFISLDLQSRQRCERVCWKPSLFGTRDDSQIYSVIGSGKSITGAYFGKGVAVVDLGADSDPIALDPEKKQITVSCAMTVADVQNFLIPNGYMLIGVPSYPGVTIGGCIAGNVHGQNHTKEGCFCESLIQFVLVHPDLGRIVVDRKFEPEIFDLTVGGFGLTGLITSAILEIEPITSAYLDVSLQTFSSIQEGYENLALESNSARYFHSWVNSTTLSSADGNGFFYKANFSSDSERRTQQVPGIGSGKNHLRFKVPLFSKLTMSALNRVYYQKNVVLPKTVQTLVDFIFPSAGRLWYFSMFGNRGIVEHQVLVPDESVSAYINKLLMILREKRPFVSLCHIKYFSGSQQFLNFNGSGLCLALHFRAGPTEFEALTLIDRLNCEYNCITNILKDSRVPRWAVKEQYSEYDDFVSRLYAFDPRRSFRNTLSQRLIDVA